MDDDRKQTLRASLQGELATLACDPQNERVDWLLGQIENYVKRWVDFGSESQLRPDVNNDLWHMIEIATDVLNEEIAQADLPTDFATLWHEYQAVVAGIRDGQRQAEDLGPAVLNMQSRIKAD